MFIIRKNYIKYGKYNKSISNSKVIHFFNFILIEFKINKPFYLMNIKI
jgi:hypothetical protein